MPYLRHHKACFTSMKNGTTRNFISWFRLTSCAKTTVSSISQSGDDKPENYRGDNSNVMMSLCYFREVSKVKGCSMNGYPFSLTVGSSIPAYTCNLENQETRVKEIYSNDSNTVDELLNQLPWKLLTQLCESGRSSHCTYLKDAKSYNQRVENINVT